MQVLPLNVWDKFDFSSLNKIWLGFVAANDVLPHGVFLSAIEIARLDNMISHKRRQDFTRGRLALRYALLSVLGPVAENINIMTDESGRLYLPDFPYLRISLSHFANAILIGIATYEFFGVDIVKPRLVHAKVPKRVFAAKEYIVWQDLDANKKQHELFCTWAVKEAIVKAFGGSVWHMRQWQVFLESKAGNNLYSGETVGFAFFAVDSYLAACAWNCA